MDKRQTPKTLDVVVTFAPYFAGEPIAMPPGRQLISRTQNIATPGTFNNGGGNIALAPAVAHQSGEVLSVDFSVSLPENYVNSTGENPKFDFGPLWLYAVDGNNMAQIGPVDNLDVTAGDQKGSTQFAPGDPTWAPQIGVRVLPMVDYGSYFVDPDAAEPVGNASLTWEFVYDEVLRTYALLYPAMRNKFALDDPEAVARFAPYTITYTSMDMWSSSRCMPPTRDLSESRRRLLYAWCRKAIAAQ